jgi:hypothetical protein
MESDLELHGNYLFVHLGCGPSEYPSSWREMDQRYLTTCEDRVDRFGRTGTNYFMGDSAVAERT